MTYLEALRSGKRYRRPGHLWRDAVISVCDPVTAKYCDIVCDDWTTEEEKITVTRAEVERAIREHHSDWVVKSIVKALGFKS